jgi:hypothetical protein
MSWRNKEDLGTELVAHVHESLRIPNDYTKDEGRGFEWWASDYAQRVWSDLGNFHNASCLYRLHCEIDFLRGCGHAAEAEQALMSTLGEGSLSAIVYDAENDLYKLHCSLYADNENETWVRRVFNAAVTLQVTEVQRLANRFAKDFKMGHAMTEHPTRGARKMHDPICEFEEKFFKPYGVGVSRWIGVEEWEDGRQALRRISIDVKTDGKLCLEASFDWSYGQRDMTLIVSAVDPHPELGHGLLFTLTAPVLMEDRHKAHVALLLNEKERKDWNWYNDIGSWCIRDGELAFVCFVPNICFMNGVLHDFAHDMGLRANWVNEHWAEIVKREWVTA